MRSQKMHFTLHDLSFLSIANTKRIAYAILKQGYYDIDECPALFLTCSFLHLHLALITDVKKERYLELKKHEKKRNVSECMFAIHHFQPVLKKKKEGQSKLSIF